MALANLASCPAPVTMPVRDRNTATKEPLRIKIRIHEHASHTLALAELDLRGDHFDPTRKAQRTPRDHPLPIVGEELAVAPALDGLALLLKEATQGKLDQLPDC
jgi:hypothetical protein